MLMYTYTILRQFSISGRLLGNSSHHAVPKHKVTPFNRFILRLTRTVKPIPNEVSFEMMDKANSRFRIGLTTVVMIICALGSVYSIRQGKEAAEAHRDSLYDKNRERYETQSGNENK